MVIVVVVVVAAAAVDSYMCLSAKYWGSCEDKNRVNVWNVMIFYETGRAVYVSCNTEAHSHKHCCMEKQ